MVMIINQKYVIYRSTVGVYIRKTYHAIRDEEGAESHICDDLLLNEELQNRIEQMLSTLEVSADIVDQLRVVLVCLHDVHYFLQTDLSEGRDDHNVGSFSRHISHLQSSGSVLSEVE